MRRSVVAICAVAIGVAAVVAGIVLGLHHVQAQYSYDLTQAHAVYGSESCGSAFKPTVTSLADTPAGQYRQSLPYAVYLRSSALLAGCKSARTAPLAGSLVLIAGGVLVAVGGALIGSFEAAARRRTSGTQPTS